MEYDLTLISEMMSNMENWKQHAASTLIDDKGARDNGTRFGPVADFDPTQTWVTGGLLFRD